MQTEAEVLETLQRFVAGEIDAPRFREELYASYEAFEAFLENDPDLGRQSNYVDGSAFQFIMDCDLDDPGGVLDAQGAVCDYFDRNQIQYKKSSKHPDLFDLILDVAPKWVDPDQKYVNETILPKAGDRSGKELRSWLTDELKKHYRFVKKPPVWIQGAHWPQGGEGPMVFLGQLDIEDYFHDNSSVYVFIDESSGQTQTLIQSH